MKDQAFELAVPAPVIPPSDAERQAVAEVSSSVDRYAQQVIARHAQPTDTPIGDESQAEKKTRIRPRRAKVQLQQALDDATKSGLAISEMKLIAARIETLSKMAEREEDSELKALTEDNTTLKIQHEADTADIVALKQRVAELEAKADEVKTVTVTVPDPGAAALREQNAALTGLLKHIASHYDTDDARSRAAIRVITSCPPAVARIFCPLVGVDFASYVQMLQTYGTDAELQSVIDKAKYDGPAVIFARAAIAVRDAETAKRMITAPDQTGVMTAEQKLRAARELVNPGRTLRVVPPPILTAEENMRSQPREVIGSPDAIPYRERITPVPVSTLERTHKSISGCAEGADFSPWV